jgi:hypothetical protein
MDQHQEKNMVDDLSITPDLCQELLAGEKCAQSAPSLDGFGHTRLIPLTDWPKYHPWPPLGGLRHMVFHGEKTGFSRVTVRVGRRLLIDEKNFFDFVQEQNQGKTV